MLIIRAFISGQIWTFIKFIGITFVILTIYYFLGVYLYDIFKNIIPKKKNNKSMIIWDNIWYTILFIHIILICTVFIKSMKRKELHVVLLFKSILALIVLMMFTLMYYLYMYYEYIGQAIGIATIAMFVGTIIVLIIKYLNISYNVVYPVFIIYSLICLIFLMTFLVFTVSILSKTYDFLT